MTATSQFFEWWFTAWNIGGWVVPFFLSIAAIAWLIFDTNNRRIRAIGWVMGAILPLLFILPSAYVGLSPVAMLRLQNLLELIFYLGLVGGIVPLIVAVGYTITYQGMRGCIHGHIYEASIPECPFCAQERVAAMPPMPVQPAPVAAPFPAAAPRASAPPPMATPARARANAWLVDERTHQNHQLCQGDTRVGRGKQNNDIVIADSAISREHILIREEHEHYTVFDRGSKTGTYVNEQRLEGPLLLVHDDVIEIGDTRLRFVTARR